MSSTNALQAYKGKKILITGHTGFKGSWLSLWLAKAGALVYGYALPPPRNPSLFRMLQLDEMIHHQSADIRDLDALQRTVQIVRPDVIFHLAAQSLVGPSYKSPLDTIQTNTMGTVHVMEAVREAGIPCVIVVVTSDKCYRNKEWQYGYRESDELGGDDPYSASKGAAEIMVHSWRKSFFHPSRIGEHGVRLASVRAGNVIGGGDFSIDRIVPDCIRYLQANESIVVRNPMHTRPWQHVLEPLSGYLALGAKLLQSDPVAAAQYCDAFNFGPFVTSNRPVKDLVGEIINCWGSGTWHHINNPNAVHETSLLHVNSERAYHQLQWSPKWNFEQTIATTIDWYKTAIDMDPVTLVDFTMEQIRKYELAEQSLVPTADKQWL